MSQRDMHVNVPDDPHECQIGPLFWVDFYQINLVLKLLSKILI